MLAREVMTSPVVTTSPQASVKEAARLLDRHDITAVPVVDDLERLVGIVSEADLLRGRVLQDPRSHTGPIHEQPELRGSTVAHVMTTAVMTAQEGADVAGIAQLMLDTGVKSVPVVRGHHVVGIVSRRDLVRLLAMSDERIQAEIQGLLGQAGLVDWSASVDDGVVDLSGHGSQRETRIAAILARTVAGVSAVRMPDDVPSG